MPLCKFKANGKVFQVFVDHRLSIGTVIKLLKDIFETEQKIFKINGMLVENLKLSDVSEKTLNIVEFADGQDLDLPKIITPKLSCTSNIHYTFV